MTNPKPVLRNLVAGACLLAAAAAAAPPDFGAYEQSRWETYREAGRVALQRGRLEDAASLFASALAEAERFGKSDPRVALSLVDLARAYDAQDKPADADRLYKRALAHLERGAGKSDPDIARVLDALAERARRLGNAAEAARLYKRAIGVWEHTGAKNDPDFAVALEHYAALLRRMGQEAEAEKLDHRAAGIRGRLGPKR